MSKIAQFIFREIMGFISAKGHIKLIFTVITAQAIKPKTIQIKEQHRTHERIGGLIKSFTLSVIIVGCIGILCKENWLTSLNIGIHIIFDDIKQVNQIRINICQNITFKMRIKKNSARANKGFNQTLFSFWKDSVEIVR